MSAADFIDDHMDNEELRAAWRSGELVSSHYLPSTLPPCRDTRVLTWLISTLGVDVLLGAIAEQTGGTLSERMRREDARRRIVELGEAAR